MERIGESSLLRLGSCCVFTFALLVAILFPATITAERFLHVHDVLEEVYVSTTPDHCGSPFAKDIELVRMKICHLKCEGRGGGALLRFRMGVIQTVRVEVPVVHLPQILQNVLPLVSRGDGPVIVQNLGEER